MTGIGVKVNVDGIPEVMAKLERFGRKTQKDLSNIVTDTGDELVYEAQAFLRATEPFPTIDTGDLINSIEWEYEQKSDGISRIHVIATAEHASYVHQGRMPGSFPPPWAIKPWAERKGVPYFPVSFAIFKRGIPEKPFLKKPWSKLRKKFVRECTERVRYNSKFWRKM
jgi:hypothetical protein